MSIGTKQRWTVLILLLGLTLSATAWVSQHDEAATAVAEAHAAQPVKAAQPEKAAQAEKKAQQTAHESGELNLEKLQREPAEDAETDLFAAKSWYVPPPPPKSLPPPPPSAPPLPFAYMGKLIEDGQMTVFLTRQDRNYVVKTGDTIDGMYKVEEVNARIMTLTYLPLKIKQTLMIGGE